MATLLQLAGEGHSFRVALCGERFGRPTDECLTSAGSSSRHDVAAPISVIP